MAQWGIVYNTTTGAIAQQLSDANVVLGGVVLGVGQAMLTVNSPVNTALYYVPSGVLTLRPKFTSSSSWNTRGIVNDGSTTATFGSSIPSGTTCSVVHTNTVIPTFNQVITDGNINITSTVTGPINVGLTLWPYLDYSTIVQAVAVGSISLSNNAIVLTGGNTTIGNTTQQLTRLLINSSYGSIKLVQNFAQFINHKSIVQSTGTFIPDNNLNQLIPLQTITQSSGIMIPYQGF